MLAQARSWRSRRYDLAVNFEPDIRSNLLTWLSGAPRRVGYSSGGGGAFLTDATPYAPRDHVSVNARRLISRAAGRTPPGPDRDLEYFPRLIPPQDAIGRARTVLGTTKRPLIGVHASGGRASKQWHVDRFATVARHLARERGATIVLTGSAADRPIVDQVRRVLDGLDFIDACGGLDLPALAALLADLDLLVTGDTGPMHLAAAMGTPVVALFGPSDPRRYGPLTEDARILRVDLPCAPCGQVRLPPERCRGHVPECMDGISVAMVIAAVDELLQSTSRPARGN
jgi:lipopolysaccharide heptosyltransferase II